MPVHQHVIHEVDRRATLRGIAQLIMLQVSELEKEQNQKLKRTLMIGDYEPYEAYLRVEDSVIPECEELGHTYDATITISHIQQAPYRQYTGEDDVDDEVIFTPRFSIWLAQSYPTQHGKPTFTLIRVNSDGQLMFKDGLRYPNWNGMMDHMSDHHMQGIGTLVEQAAEFLIHGYHRTGSLLEQRRKTA